MIVTLNNQQQDVIKWIEKKTGSLILVARAGCGKTFTIINGAVVYIVEHNKGQVAVMAFNKAAAEEFKARLKKLAEDTGDDRLVNFKHVSAGTVHSFGFQAWKRRYKGVQLDERKVYNIINKMADEDGDEDSVFKEFASAIRDLVSLAKQSAFGYLQAVEDAGAWQKLIDHHGIETNGSTDDIINAAMDVYLESLKQDRDIIDFDDMILAPLVHNASVWQYDWVLIDEAQDTNAARRALALKMLKPVTGRMIAVGDDRQAIYGFTGADSDSLEIIRNELNAETLPLSITYRCPKTVVAEANKLVPDLQAHESAPEGVVRAILKNQEAKDGTRLAWFQTEDLTKNDAVLCRLTKPLIEEAYAMFKAGLGCRVEGREIGEGLIQLARRWKSIRNLGPLNDKLREYSKAESQKWLGKGNETQAQAVEDKCEALMVICSYLLAQGKQSISDLADHIRSLFGDDNGQQNVVTLSTIHKSKGREWDRVYILNRRGTLPSKWARKDWQLAQEANLEYVAVTRAKKELIDVVFND